MNRITALAIMFMVGISTLDVSGKSSSSGGGSRSFSSSSSSRSSSSSSSKPSSSSSSWGSSSSNSAKSQTGSVSSSKPNTSTPQTSTRQQSNVEVAKYKAASQSGTVFKTREAAVADFKTKNASTYTSKFTSEPTTRPSYIPQTYSQGGVNHTIVYNQSGGGYGYWSGGGPGIGSFLLYDMMSDQLMMNRMMDQRNYYVGSAPVPYHSPFVAFMWIVASLVVIGLVAWWICRKL